jgi:hypothetical protein
MARASSAFAFQFAKGAETVPFARFRITGNPFSRKLQGLGQVI